MERGLAELVGLPRRLGGEEKLREEGEGRDDNVGKWKLEESLSRGPGCIKTTRNNMKTSIEEEKGTWEPLEMRWAWANS